MRFNLFCSLLFVAVVLFFATLPASAQSTQTATVSMQHYKGARAIVAVTVDGKGPYDFMVDTGATATVVDSALFSELGLQADGAVTVSSSAAAQTQQRSTVKQIAVGGAEVENLVVLSTPVLPFGSELRGVRGILGENFLQHFDVLIDNKSRKLTLDATTGLAESLDGERLPITFPAPAAGQEMRYRPLVTVTIPDFASEPVTVLLDSGADALVMVATGGMKAKSSGTATAVHSINGTRICSASENRVRWGKASIGDVSTSVCTSTAPNTRDYVGNMPTAIFTQLFISHAGAYAVVNPGKRKAGVQMAAVTPMAR